MCGHILCWFFLLLAPMAAAQTVRFDLYRDYLIVVRGSAGPLKGLNFVLDTGANPSVLDRGVAQKLHLQVSPATIRVIAGSVQAGESVAPSLQFGPLRRENLQVLVEDLSFFQNAFPVHIDGIIGLDLLGQRPFLINYRTREVRFGLLPALAASLPVHMNGGLPIVDAGLNSHSVHVLFDTGAASLILFGTSPPRPLKISVAIGEFDRKQVWMQSVLLGQAEFGRKPAFLVQKGGDTGHEFDGIVSPAALGITQVAFDLGRGVLGFSR